MEHLLLGTEIAGEQEPHQVAAVRRRELHLHRRRAEHVAGVPVTQMNAGGRLDPAVILDRLEQLQRLAGMFLGVDRIDRRFALALPPAVVAVGVGLLDLGGIQQHEGQQIGGWRRAVDRPVEPVFHQLRQQPGMVDMSVGQDQKPGRSRVERKRFVVEGANGLVALEHPAVHQEAGACRLDQGTGAGDCPRCSVECQRCHWPSPSTRPRQCFANWRGGRKGGKPGSGHSVKAKGRQVAAPRNLRSADQNSVHSPGSVESAALPAVA